jgi:hypothetical protein
MANSWIEHVRDFANKKKMKYNDALKSADCKAEYQKNKSKSMDESQMDMNKNIVKVPKNKKVMMEEPVVETIEPVKAMRKPRIKKMKEV